MSLKDILDSYMHEFHHRYAGRYYGKYRAIVTDNQDGAGLGRIKVQCPVLFGPAVSAWCWPASAFGGNAAGAPHGAVFLPDVGDMVWVELEEGNSQKPPIWIGGPWSTESVPDHARALPDEADNNGVKGHPRGVIPESTFNASETGKVRVIQMPSGSRLEFDETEGTERVQLYHKSGAHIEIMQDGTINIGAAENVRVQASGGLLQFYSAVALEQNIDGPAFLSNEGDWQQSVKGSYALDVTGDYKVNARTITMEMGGDTKNTFAGSLTELVLGKEQRTIANQSSTMVGTDWFLQAAGAAGITAQNSGGLPTDLGIDFTAQNSRAVLQSTDASGLATSAKLELNGTPGNSTLSATLANLLRAPQLWIGPTVTELGAPPTRPGVYADTLATALAAIVLAFDTHVHISGAPGAPTVIPTVPMSTTVTPPLIASTANPFVLQQ